MEHSNWAAFAQSHLPTCWPPPCPAYTCLLSAPSQGCSFHSMYVAWIIATPHGAQWGLTFPDRITISVGMDKLYFLQKGDDLKYFSGLVRMFNKVKNTEQPVWSGARHLVKRKCNLLSRLWLFATLWTVAHQVPLSMKIFRQEYWSRLLCPSPGDLPNPGIEPGSPTLWADSLPSETLPAG